MTKSVCEEGSSIRRSPAIRLAREQGFGDRQLHAVPGREPARGCRLSRYGPMQLRREGITVSPIQLPARSGGRMCFSGAARGASKLFSRDLQRGRGRRTPWSFNHSALFLDFLAGIRAISAPPWSTPTYNIFGCSRPCYLLSDEGFARPTAVMLGGHGLGAKYGVGATRAVATAWPIAVSEGTAVDDAFAHPIKSPQKRRCGARECGPMAPSALPVRRPAAPCGDVSRSPK